MVNVPTIKLQPTGQEMPQVGFGLWKVTNETCADTVYHAIKTGYRLFDGAFDYGNEKEAGQGVKRAIDEGLVKREDLFIASKLWNTFHENERVKPITKTQLEWWGLEYFDLFLIHFPIALEYVDPAVSYPSGWKTPDGSIKPIKAPIQETWRAMEELVDEGLVKNVGISNFQGALILDLLRYCRIRPAVLQIEHHPYLIQPDLIRLAKSEGIAVTGYSSFGPASFRELDWKKAFDTPTLFEHPTITAIAKKHNKTPAQVLLRWPTQRGLAVIPKSNNRDRLLQNLDVTSFDLEESEIQAISGLDKSLRFNNPIDYLGTLPIFA
ncbi:NADP-dependent oxidoreductase domain-containing protein [Tuber indicum]|nr:NADP-dependent oxidoreductase domain-containing protein [Tuber indicum]